MLNVQALTQTLSAMQLPQLQQYAALHKDDPYVVTMALSIANQKKQAIAAQQGQAGMQPQPKVVDAEIQGMAPQALPEDTGIAQLPAENMQFAAEGGIMGYAGGGGVPRYNGEASSLTGDIPGFVAGTGNFRPQAGEEEIPWLRRQWNAFHESNAAARAAETNRRVNAGEVAPSPDMRATTTAMDAQAAQQKLDAAAPPTRRSDYTRESYGEQPAADKPSAAPAPAAQQNAGITQLPTGSAAMRMPSQADQIKQFQDILAKTKAVDPAAAERKALGEELVAQTERRQKAFDEEQAARGDVYKGREERLSKQESEINSRKATNEGLAILNAGLAIMSTPGGLAMAIGKGARVGTEQYAAGLEKIQAAQDKLGEARDRLDDLRINRADLTAKERRDLQTQADNAKLKAKELGIEGLMSAAGVSEKRAATMFDATTKYGIAQLQESGANARANAQIAAAHRNPQLELIQAIQKDPQLASTYQAMHGTKNDLMTQYTDYLGKNPTGSIEDFLKTKALFSTLGNITAAKPVSSLPSGASVAPR
jgi:hypothetical protein